MCAFYSIRRFFANLKKLNTVSIAITGLGLRLALMNVQDSFRIGKTMTCDLWPMTCVLYLPIKGLGLALTPTQHVLAHELAIILNC